MTAPDYLDALEAARIAAGAARTAAAAARQAESFEETLVRVRRGEVRIATRYVPPTAVPAITLGGVASSLL